MGRLKGSRNSEFRSDRDFSKTSVEVLSVEDIDYEGPVYDLSTESGDFCSAGLVSHNCAHSLAHLYFLQAFKQTTDPHIAPEKNREVSSGIMRVEV